jgi:hypothetical protein
MVRVRQRLEALLDGLEFRSPKRIGPQPLLDVLLLRFLERSQQVPNQLFADLLVHSSALVVYRV